MAPPPPTRKEQLALDELLNDIYRGIETLPDNDNAIVADRNGKQYKITHFNQEVKQYELPSSSPLVKQHKQDIASLRKQQQQHEQTPYPFASSASNLNNNDDLIASNASINPHHQHQQQQQPGRSTLKRQQQQQQQQQAQSLASFMKAELQNSNPGATADSNSQTGTSKRRVRIVEHPEKLAKQQQQHQTSNQRYPVAGSPYARYEDEEPNVKYVNSNQLIYHEEPASKWNSYNKHDSVYTPVVDQDVLDQYRRDSDSDDDSIANGANEEPIDGTTRVEYYHTSWLDRQLGRASKRRSSKELNERQVKEKAMIEELKRSLKNGAITLKRSLKGGNKNKRNNQNIYHGQYLTTADDQLNSYTDRPAHKAAAASGQSSIFATIPRKHYNNNNNNSTKSILNKPEQQQHQQQYKAAYAEPEVDNQQESYNNYKKPSSLIYSNNSTHQYNIPGSTASPAPDYSSPYSSRTLPNQSSTNSTRHQLIKSHYKPGNNLNTSSPAPNNQHNNNNPYPQTSTTNNSNNMKYPQSSTLCHKPAINTYQATQEQYNTISRIPSASEVVRSALESNKSHLEDQRLRKTINSLDTPSPYPSSPQTPTQQLKAASPSLSPSPTGSRGTLCGNGTKDLYNRNGQEVLRGTRIIPAPSPSITSTTTTDNYRQPGTVYANPHASLMQQRAEQQARGIYGPASGSANYRGNNQASLREFNELDSLLKSLSPHSSYNPAMQKPKPNDNMTTSSTNLNRNYPTPATHSTQVTPGYSSKPASATLGGYGGVFPPASNQQQHQQPTDVYAKIQRQNNPATKPLQSSHLNNTNFTLDVTDDRSTLDRQSTAKQHQPWEKNNQTMAPTNEFEILPSMEDYQNITKLNPVRNHYWYKPNMTRDRAIALLKDKPQGTFIVRDSNSFRGAYGLAVKVAKLPPNVLNNSNLRDPRANPSDELIRHFLIEPTANGVRVKGYANEPVFGSLPNLIYQHSLTELALPCRLIIPRADIEDPEFNLKQKQFVEDFLASKEEAKDMPYKRTSPNGGYRRYPGDVLVHNEHRIIFQ